MTEENIVYQLLEEIRGASLINDEVVDERTVRAFMRSHRGYVIAKHYLNGTTISESEFQSFGIVNLVDTGGVLTYVLPNLVRLSKNQGIKITTASGYMVPVLSLEDFNLSKKNIINKSLPKARIENNTLYFYSGLSSSVSIDLGVDLDAVIEEVKTSQKIYLELILDNPDDLASYDWTVDQYPLASELITTLKQSIIAKEFNTLVNVKVDEVPNMKNDNIRYHDQGKID